jgi:hypothetical protein
MTRFKTMLCKLVWSDGEKARPSPVMIVGIPVQIRTGCLRITSHKYCRYSLLVDCFPGTVRD